LENSEETIKRLKHYNVILYNMLTTLIDAYIDEDKETIDAVIFDYTTEITATYSKGDNKS